MKNTKKVTRRWKDKYGNITVRTYTYETKVGAAKKSAITFASGKVKKTKLTSFIKTHKDKISTESDKMLLDRTINRLAQNNKLVSADRLYASFTGNQLLGMLSNTGSSIEELTALANTTREDLLNADNWSNNWSIYTNSKGEQFEFTFTYEGAVFKKVAKQ